jgi:ankyrin repeat protein
MLAACGFTTLSLDDVQYLVEQWPGAVKAVDNEGNPPLHLACKFEPALEVVRFLVEHWLDSVHYKTKDGETPFDIAIEKGCDDEVISWLEVPWRSPCS